MKSYFTIRELTRSTTAEERGIDNTPDEQSLENLHKLIDNVLDPLRRIYGKPIYVNSGYRSEELNKAVGGHPNSHHKYGYAADITTYTKEGNKTLFNILKTMPKTQNIDEYDYSWVHISYNDKDLRNQSIHIG